MAASQPLPQALDDIRVLDLAGEMGLYCTKLLADLSADVIAVEPPGGAPARRVGPFYHDNPHPEKSLYFFNLSTNKRSITLDIEAADGRELFHRLMATADVVVETFPPGYLDGLGLGYAALSQIKPDIILTSITGFGQWGPHSHYQAPDIVGQAMSGMMYLAGFPEDPPNSLYGDQAYYCASIRAATGTLIALFHRDRTGQGQHVDVSVQEANAMNQETAMQYWDIRHEIRRRSGDQHRMPGVGVYPCKDGYVVLRVGLPGFGAPWPVLLDWMAEEDLAEDLDTEEWRSLFAQMDLRTITALYFGTDRALTDQWRQWFGRVEEVLSRFLMQHTKAEVYEGGQRRELLIGAVNTPEDLAKSPQLNYRSWFAVVEHPELATTLQYPGPPYRLQETPWRIRRRPPLVGEHNLEIYQGELGLTREQMAALMAAGVI